MSTGSCVTLNCWHVHEHVCVHIHASVYPSGTDCSGFPTVSSRGKGEEGWLALVQQTRGSSEVACRVNMHVMVAERTEQNYCSTKTVQTSNSPHSTLAERPSSVLFVIHSCFTCTAVPIPYCVCVCVCARCVCVFYTSLHAWASVCFQGRV